MASFDEEALKAGVEALVVLRKYMANADQSFDGPVEFPHAKIALGIVGQAANVRQRLQAHAEWRENMAGHRTGILAE